MSFNGAGKYTLRRQPPKPHASVRGMEKIKAALIFSNTNSITFPPINPNKQTARECAGCGAPRVFIGPCEYCRSR